MAAVTLTNTTSNYDETLMLPLLNGEAITLNNSILNIDSDVRHGQNGAIFGAITISSTLGGQLNFDGSKVWQINFDASTGNVPTLGTYNVQNCTGGTSGATGEFLGIYTALGTVPLASGVAMPASGFIKFRSKVGTFLDNEVITLPGGATINIDSVTGGVRSWISVGGLELATGTIPRLGIIQSLSEEWFELGTTNGTDDQTFQYPINDICPAIQIETGVGTGIYEWYYHAANLWGSAIQVIPTNTKGKGFGCTTSGLITIARRATNPCGFKPDSGLRVRIPNIICFNTTAANYALNTINTTLSSRWDLTTTAAGTINLKNMIGNWYILGSSAFSVTIKNCAFSDQINVSNVASLVDVENTAVTLSSATALQPFFASNCFSGVNLKKSLFFRGVTSANTMCVGLTDCLDVNLDDTSIIVANSTVAVTRSVSTTNTVVLTRCNNTNANNLKIIGARVNLSTCFNTDFTNLKSSDLLASLTTATNGQYLIDAGSSCLNLTINGYDNIDSAANTHFYNGLVNFLNSDKLNIFNIGTSAVPVNFGTLNIAGLLINVGVSTNVVIRRVYTDTNFRTAPVAFANTSQNILIENFWAAGADAYAMSGVNAIAKGSRFTIDTAGATAVYGTHWTDAFISTTSGQISISMNEPLADTADQAQLISGTPSFTSTGNLYMPTIGDTYEWTNPYFILGYTSLTNTAPLFTGGTTVTTNISYTYRIDTGFGFSGLYKTLNATNLSSEIISPTIGFRLQVRATTITAATTNTIIRIRIIGTTNSVDQQIQYPLPTDRLGEISGLISGSTVEIYNITTDVQLSNQVVPGTSLVIPYYNAVDITDGDVLRITINNTFGLTSYLTQTINAIANTSGFSALASQELDSVYTLYNIDGSLITKFSPDYINDRIDWITTSDYTAAEWYAWFKYNLSTLNGNENWSRVVRAIDGSNIEIDQAVKNLLFNITNATNVIQTDNIRVFRKDEFYPVLRPTTGGGAIDAVWRNVVYLAEVGTSGLTPGEAATLAKLDTLTEDVSGLRFTAKALEESPAGGGGGTADWTTLEKEQIRNRLGIDGTASAPVTGNPTLALETDVTTSQTAIIAEINNNEAKIDIIDTNVDLIKAKTDTLVNTDLTGIATATDVTAAQSAIIAEINANEAKLDIIDTNVDAIKAKTDTLVNTDLTGIATSTDVSDIETSILSQINTRESEADAATRQAALLTAIGSGGVTPAQVYDYFAFGARPDIFKADLTAVLTSIALRSTSAELSTQTTTLLTAIGTGGVTEAQIYDYFTALNREDVFKADVSTLATSVELEAAKDEILGATVAIDIPAIVSAVRADLERIGGPIALTKIDTSNLISDIVSLNDISEADVYAQIVLALGDENIVDDSDIATLQSIILNAIANKVLIRKDEIKGVVQNTNNITATIIDPVNLIGIVEQNDITTGI